MALEATHMCFALDVKDRFKIEDIASYIQGTVYPDSRYVSGISRELTHGHELLKKEFAANDFKKGWQVHLLCDKIQRRVFHQNVPGFDKFKHEGFEKNQWIHFTAAKIIADIGVLQSFDIQPIVKLFNSEFCPNDEDISDIRKYNRIMIDLYANKKVPSVDDYMEMWSKLGIRPELSQKVREKTDEFLHNEFREIIWSCYEKMPQVFDEFYERLSQTTI